MNQKIIVRISLGLSIISFLIVHCGKIIPMGGNEITIFQQLDRTRGFGAGASGIFMILMFLTWIGSGLILLSNFVKSPKVFNLLGTLLQICFPALIFVGVMEERDGNLPSALVFLFLLMFLLLITTVILLSTNSQNSKDSRRPKIIEKSQIFIESLSCIPGGKCIVIGAMLFFSSSILIPLYYLLFAYAHFMQEESEFIVHLPSLVGAILIIIGFYQRKKQGIKEQIGSNILLVAVFIGIISIGFTIVSNGIAFVLFFLSLIVMFIAFLFYKRSSLLDKQSSIAVKYICSGISIQIFYICIISLYLFFLYQYNSSYLVDDILFAMFYIRYHFSYIGLLFGVPSFAFYIVGWYKLSMVQINSKRQENER